MEKLQDRKKRLTRRLDDLKKGFPGHKECRFERNRLRRILKKLKKQGLTRTQRAPLERELLSTWEDIGPKLRTLANRQGDRHRPDRREKIMSLVDDYDSKAATFIKSKPDGLKLTEHARAVYERRTEMLHVWRCLFLLEPKTDPEAFSVELANFRQMNSKTSDYKSKYEELRQGLDLNWRKGLVTEADKQLNDAVDSLFRTYVQARTASVGE